MIDGFLTSRGGFGENMDFQAVMNDFEEDRMCPSCKTHESDIRETGEVGCANCFKVFRDLVSRQAYKIHGRLEHLGKVPVKVVSKAEKQKEIQALREKMQKCVEAEDFEGASIFKRQIESLKEDM